MILVVECDGLHSTYDWGHETVHWISTNQVFFGHKHNVHFQTFSQVQTTLQECKQNPVIRKILQAPLWYPYFLIGDCMVY